MDKLSLGVGYLAKIFLRKGPESTGKLQGCLVSTLPGGLQLHKVILVSVCITIPVFNTLLNFYQSASGEWSTKHPL